MGLKEEWFVEVDGHFDDSTSEGSTASNSSAPSSREQSPNQMSTHNLTQDLLAPSSLREIQGIDLGQEQGQSCPSEPLCFDDERTQAAPSTPSSATIGILRKHGEARSNKARRTVRFSIQEEAKRDLLRLQSVWTPGTCLKNSIREQHTFSDVAVPPTAPPGFAVVQ